MSEPKLEKVYICIYCGSGNHKPSDSPEDLNRCILNLVGDKRDLLARIQQLYQDNIATIVRCAKLRTKDK